MVVLTSVLAGAVAVAALIALLIREGFRHGDLPADVRVGARTLPGTDSGTGGRWVQVTVSNPAAATALVALNLRRARRSWPGATGAPAHRRPPDLPGSRRAQRGRGARRPQSQTAGAVVRHDGRQPALLIRRARADDARALALLAELDEAPVPAEPLLVGEVGGDVWVAVSMASLDHIAHPFRRSGEVAELTVARARQLRDTLTGERP